MLGSFLASCSKSFCSKSLHSDWRFFAIFSLELSCISFVFTFQSSGTISLLDSDAGTCHSAPMVISDNKLKSIYYNSGWSMKRWRIHHSSITSMLVDSQCILFFHAWYTKPFSNLCFDKSLWRFHLKLVEICMVEKPFGAISATFILISFNSGISNNNLVSECSQ